MILFSKKDSLQNRTGMKKILETDRLRLREFNTGDIAFIIELLNSEGWLKFIGDRNVRTTDQAKAYLENGPLKSYAANGYGLSMVERKEDNKPIGMCGILNRDTLENPDIGFAFLPDFSGMGYALEIVSATLRYAKSDLKILKVLAITLPNNTRSISLLEKVGFTFKKTIRSPDGTQDLSLFEN
jgi:RimJ/RimL family protein N-acetyltransferase